MFTDINIYPINNKTDHMSEKYIFYSKKSKTKGWYFPDFRSDPLLHETDPRIRIHIKMKHILWNTAFSHLFMLEEENDWKGRKRRKKDWRDMTQAGIENCP